MPPSHWRQHDGVALQRGFGGPSRNTRGLPKVVAARLTEAEKLLARGQARLAQARLDAAEDELSRSPVSEQHRVHQWITDLRRSVTAKLPKSRPERPSGDGPGIVTPEVRARRSKFPPSRSIRTVSGGLPTLGRDR